MTRLDQLTALRDKVRDGTLPEAVFHGTSGIRDHWAYETGLSPYQRRQVYLAYNGSVDAAFALFAALLPGWVWNAGHLDDPSLGYVATVSEGPFVNSPSWRGFAPDPARALLLAMFEAMIKKEEG